MTTTSVELVQSEVKEDLVQATVLIKVLRRVDHIAPPPFRDLLGLPEAEAAMLDSVTTQYRMTHQTLTKLIVLQAIRMGLIGALLQPLVQAAAAAAQAKPAQDPPEAPAAAEEPVAEAPEAPVAEAPSDDGWEPGGLVSDEVEGALSGDAEEPTTPEGKVVALFMAGIEFETIGRRVGLGVDEVKAVLRKAGKLKKGA